VLARLEWNVDTDGLGEVATPNPAGKDDGFGFDVPLLGLDAYNSAVFGDQLRHRDTLDDSRTTGFGPLGQRHGGVDRGCDPVAGDEQRPNQIIGVEERKELLGPIEVDHLGLDIDSGRHRGSAQDLLPAFLIGRHRNRAGCTPAGRLAGLVLEFFEESGRIRRQPREAVRRLELGYQTRRVPGGSPSEGSLLDDCDVGDAPPGQVIGDAGSDDATADH